MLTTVDVMPDTARLWVYQSDRRLTEKEQVLIGERTQQFIDQVAAQGSGLTATYVLEGAHFLVIMVDERFAEASGCSIDASVGLVRDLEKVLQLSFLDRSKVAVKIDDEITLLPLNSIKKSIAEGLIDQHTVVFNNAVSNYADWKNNWRQKASDSWMARFF